MRERRESSGWRRACRLVSVLGPSDSTSRPPECHHLPAGYVMPKRLQGGYGVEKALRSGLLTSIVRSLPSFDPA